MHLRSRLSIAIVCACLYVGILVPILYFEHHADDRSRERRCQVYCNCTVTMDCLYTFEYSDVVDCNCSK
jgi:hypothetical protein